MVNTLSTIIPIFAIIFLGWFVRHKGLVPVQLLGPANRLVYYVAVPAMIFREIAAASFTEQFNATLLGCTLLPVVLVFLLSFLGFSSQNLNNLLKKNMGVIKLLMCGLFLTLGMLILWMG